ncbi:hypothetical protein V6N11_058447 [Hibiscus sabdariffa]|uniref:Uncharacterized protein n=1 Tax=Hibiscus sabdariffa TaxID=183260 RepID=A0ABR2U4A2_9ROSI
MEQARLDCYSFGINCQSFISFYTSASINCLNKMTKRMSRTETTGLAQAAVTSSLSLSQEYFPHKANCCCIFLAAETLLLPIPRRRLLSAETYTPSRLCVLGLGIGSADRFGPGFGAFLVQCLLEKYVDLIALPVVFSFPTEVGASAADSSGFAAGRPALPSSSLSVVTTWYLLCRLAGCCSGWSGLEEQSLWMIRLAGAFPLRLRVSSAAIGGSAGAGASSLALELPGTSAVLSWL